MGFVYSLVPEAPLGGNPLVASLLVIAGFLLGLRLCHGVRRRRHVGERVLILGTSPLGRQVIEEIERQPYHRYTLVGLVVLLIKLDSRGPVFFIQERVGLYRQPFKLVKFRTMRPVGRPKSEWEQDNRDRITRVGMWLRQFRLDELPQLVNVFRGDMNLVGPRPHPVTNLGLMILVVRNLSEVSGDAIPYYSLRCSVRPGITGWAQVRYRYANSIDEEMEKIRYDFYYLKHMSFWLDLRILFETVKTVFSRSGSREETLPAGEAVTRHLGSAGLPHAKVDLRVQRPEPSVGVSPPH